MSVLKVIAFRPDIIIANKKAVRAMNGLNHAFQEGPYKREADFTIEDFTQRVSSYD